VDKDIQVKLISYRLVRPELFKTLEQSKTHFESYTNDLNSHGHLNAFIDLIEQVLGCLKIMPLQGIDMLASEILHLANHLHEIAAEKRDDCLSTLSYSLIQLEQYLEYFDHKEAEFPTLLLTTINQLRAVGGRQSLPEHYFYRQNSEFVQAIALALETSDEISNESIPADKLTRLRQMYQIGLADYIRETNQGTSLNMMIRSLNRIVDQSIPNGYALIFRFAAAAANAMQKSKINPTRARKQLFAAIDQQFRNLVNNPGQAPKVEHGQNLICGFGYLFLVSGCTDQIVRTLVEQYAIKPLFFNEMEIERERERLCNPSASDDRGFMRALSTELIAVKDNIELAFKTSELQNTVDFPSLTKPLKEICRIFEMAKMTDSVTILQEILVRIEEWDIQKTVLSEEQFSEIADQLTLIENQTLELNSLKSNGSEGEPIQLGVLQEAQQNVIEQTKDGLSLTKRSIDAYLSSGGDSMNLVNLEALMETVRGGTQFLGLKEVTEILKICQDYIRVNLIESKQPLTSEKLETLADVIISVEYYLENMDLKLNSNQKILTLAVDGIKELAA